MAENDSKTPTALVSAGTPVAGKPGFLPSQQGDNNGAQGAASDGMPPVSAAATTTPATTPAAGAGSDGKPPADGKPDGSGDAPKMDFDQMKTFLKAQGLEGFESLDDLKGLVAKAKTPAPVEPTPEQKAAKDAADEKRMLDLWIQGKGKVEDFVAFKQLAASDVKELSVNEVKRELRKAGFTDEAQISEIIKTRYYLDNPDEWVKEENEDQAVFDARKADYKKKATYGSQQLESRGSQIRTKAEGYLNGLREALKAEELDAQEEAKSSSKVDELTTSFTRDVNLDLGEIDKKNVDPVPFKVPEEVVTKVAAMLKDPSQRQQFLFNPDNTLNLTNLFELMVKAEYGILAAKEAYVHGGNRQVEVFKKVFGGKLPQQLGVGGETANNLSGRAKGQIVGAGAPERVVRKSN